MIRHFFEFLLALYLLLLDGLIWVSQQLRDILAAYDLVQSLENRLRMLGRYETLGVFVFVLVPAGLIKLGVLGLLAMGLYKSAISILILGKITFTVVLAWLYRVCRPKLIEFGWFGTAEGWVLLKRDQVYAYLHSTRAYKWAVEFKGAIRRRIHDWLGR